MDSIACKTSSLKYFKATKLIIGEEVQAPLYDLVRRFASRIYTGRLTEEVMGEFTDLVSKAFTLFIKHLNLVDITLYRIP